MSATLTFKGLITSIRATDEYFRSQAVRAVNLALTLRNWCFGWYIAEFELQGADRARYGEHLLTELSSELKQLGISNAGRRQLYQYLTFYRVYPEIVRSLSAQLASPPDELVDRLSYSHFELLISLEDDLKRGFYEAEAIRGQWTVRELRRQIGSLLFERTGLSTDKIRLAEMVRQGAETNIPALAIRDPYVFEFLGIKSREVMGETHLEDAWSNTPWPAWIASSLSPTTKWNYQRRKTWNASWRQSSRNKGSHERGSGKEAMSPLALPPIQRAGVRALQAENETLRRQMGFGKGETR